MNKKTIYISNSSNGIGDHVTGLYAAAGFETEYKVYYITKYAEWFKYVRLHDQSGLHIVAALTTEQMEQIPVHIIDCHHGYKTDTKTNHLGEHERALQGELKHRITRYIENITKALKIKKPMYGWKTAVDLTNIPVPEHMPAEHKHMW